MRRTILEAQGGCPYYWGHGAGRIVCRGYGGIRRLALEFDRPGRLLEHYRQYCRGQAACPQRRTIEACRRSDGRG